MEKEVILSSGTNNNHMIIYNNTLENIKFWGAMVIIAIFAVVPFIK